MEQNLEDGEYNYFCILRDYYLMKHNISVEQAEFMAEQELERLKGSMIPRRRTYGRTQKQVVYWGNN